MPIMMINTAVLHIFDFNTNVCIVSQKDLDFSSDVVYEYVSKRLNCIIGDAAQKTGVFYATSAFQMKLRDPDFRRFGVPDRPRALPARVPL